MSFAGLSYVAVVLAAAAGWIVGAIWYNALAAQWLAAQGKTKPQFAQEMAAKKGTPAAYAPFALAMVANLVMAWVLAGVIGHLGVGQVTWRNGVISGFFVWLGFVVTTLSVNYAFGGRTPMLTVIDAGHWLAVLIVMGTIIGLWGV